MKPKFKKFTNPLKSKSFILVVFLGLGLIVDTYGQLQTYLNNMEQGYDFYFIQKEMYTYLDSLEQTMDSSLFYAGSGQFKEFKKFEKLWRPRVSPHGDFTKFFDAEYNYYTNLKDNYNYLTTEPWHELGPNSASGGQDEFDGNGPVEFLSFFDDGTAASTRYMLTGSLPGGLFYSTDYGETWNSTGTDTQWAQSGCAWAVFHPTNHQVWYAASSGNGSSCSSWIGATGGIYRTADEGQIWTQIANHEDMGSAGNKIFKLIIDPVNPTILYAATRKGVYKTTNCETDTASWTLELPHFAYDLEMKPDTNNVLYCTAFTDSLWNIMISNDYGDNWNALPVQPDTLTNDDIDEQFYTIEVSKAKPGYVYCMARDTSSYSYYFNDLGDPHDWIYIDQQDDGNGFGGGHSFGAEQVNDGEEIIVSYETRLRKYNINTGLIFEKTLVHADVEDVVYHPYNFREVWACTHGGVEKSIDGGANWEDKYIGLGVAQVEKMATSYSDPKYVMAGLYHDGTQQTDMEYEAGWEPPWKGCKWGDGMKPLIDNINPNHMWASSQKGSWSYSSTSFNSTSTGVFNNGGAFWQSIGVLNKQNPAVFYRNKFIDTLKLKEEVYRSTNRGLQNGNNEFISSFHTLLQLPANNLQNILGLYTPYNNGDYLVAYLREVTPAHDTTKWHVLRTTNANADSASVVWERLSIPETGTWITAIDFDPYNPDIMYLARASSNEYHADSMILKLDYSNPTSPVFTDLTFNLPLTAIGENCLAADKFGDGALYLATEFGVFYTNNELQNNNGNEWVLVGTELPHTTSSGIEINYPSNTLRVGTWGRGVWELPLACTYNTLDLHITQDTTWNTFIRMDRDIVVDSGAVLTIANDAEIAFPDNAKLTVLPGGKLIIDGGTLTNLCYPMWPGVEVWGDPAQTQTATMQGVIEVINGGTIENAMVAVRLGKTIVPDGGEGEVSYGDGGGLIFAANAVFRNNKTGVAFEAYPNNNISYFMRCTFETTKALLNDQLPQNLLVLNSVVGIDIKGCTFQFSGNAITSYAQRGNGIYSFNSSFNVDEICTSGTTPCTTYQATSFEKLNYGIRANGISTSRTCNIANSIFTGNKRGVYLSGLSLAGITSNEFTVLSDTIDAYGLYLDQCDAYCIENNYLIGPNEGSSLGIGLVINQSGGEPNEVYWNNFELLKFGILAQNENRDARSGTGLVLKCNQYDDCSYDHVVTWDGLFMSQSAGIAQSQGSASSNAADMAGNLFDIHGLVPDGDYDDINNEANHITYYYPNNSDEDNVEPVDFTQNTVTISPQSILPNNWTFENGCPPTEEPGGGSSGSEGGRGQMAAAQVKIDSLENILAVLIDGGNTGLTQSEVENSLPPETMDIYTGLMNKSPYLSDTVVSTAIEKEDVLPGAMIRDIMVANPNTAKSDELINKLDERYDPLPAYMKAQILQGRSIVSIREENEAKLAACKLDEAKGFSSLIRGFMNEMTNPVVMNDSLVQAFANRNTLQAKYNLAFLYLNKGDTQTGQIVLDSIPLVFALDSRQQAGHQLMSNYFDLLCNLANSNKELLEADSAQIETLINIELAGLDKAKAYSRNILLALDEMIYEEPIILPDLFKTSEAIDAYEDLLSKAMDLSELIRVFPNPAKDFLMIAYELESETNTIIEVSDINGKPVYHKVLPNRTDQVVIDTSQWEAGLYITTLRVKGDIVESVKFTVID